MLKDGWEKKGFVCQGRLVEGRSFGDREVDVVERVKVEERAGSSLCSVLSTTSIDTITPEH